MPADLARPDYLHEVEYATTLGPEVADLCEQAGFAPYPEQRLVLDGLFGIKAGGQVAAFETDVICSRQQLKTGLEKQAVLGWTFLWPRPPLIIWSAHEFETAQAAWTDLCTLIESNPDLDRELARRPTGGAMPEIVIRNPKTGETQRIRFKTRTGGGGRGLTANKVILDEGLYLSGAHMGALLPTLIQVHNPQVLIGSSAGYAKSHVLRAAKARGRQGSDPRQLYAEWCAPPRKCARDDCDHVKGTPGCALDNVALWRHACPVSARKDPTMVTIQDLRNTMSPLGFMTEVLGWWEEPTGEAAIDLDRWSSRELTDPGSEIAPASRIGLAVDVSPKRTWSAIGAAGLRTDQRLHVEVTGRPSTGEVDYRPGTAWVVDRAAAIALDHGIPVHMAAGSAAASLIPDFKQLGVQVVEVSPGDVAAACGMVADKVADGTLVHLEQPELDAAIDATRWRDVGDRTRVWGRRQSAADITPTYAITLAAWAATSGDPGGFNVY